MSAIAGARIVLRPILPGDMPAVEEWWPEAAAVVRGRRDPEIIDFASALASFQMIEGNGATLVIARSADPAPIGLVTYRAGSPAAGWLTVEFLALSVGRRGWGFGSEAVRLIESAGLAERFLASVYVRNGLGLYFWLRMGYRPVRPEEAFWREREPEDIISMVRTK
ncbi:MAG: hypothetical protein WD904_05755 [Dehalococcoidia bacterium]